MKVFAVSDLHLSINNPKPMDIFGPAWDNYVDILCTEWQKKVGEDDIVLIAGDISWAMYLTDAVKDLEFISKLNGKKIILRGNHDYWWKSISAIRSVLPSGMFAVQNDSIKIGDYVICGTRGWTIPENNEKRNEEDEKIFQRELIRLKLSLESAKAKQTNCEKVICMLHYPPFNSKREDSEITQLLEEYNVDCVIYGHIHGTSCRAELEVKKNGIDYFLTSCDLIKNSPVEIF